MNFMLPSAYEKAPAFASVSHPGAPTVEQAMIRLTAARGRVQPWLQADALAEAAALPELMGPVEYRAG
jgi:hypothetical protein